MNLNQLIYAGEINRLGSFSRAAQVLFISQSALSKSIRALEVELGREIFIRTSEGITTTEFGRSFLEETEKTLLHIERLKHLASQTAKAGDAPLKFSASCGQMIFASEIFANLMVAHISVETDFQFFQKTSSEVFLDVKEERSDIGILMTLNSCIPDVCNLFQQNDMEYHTLGRLPLGVAVDRGNPINQMGVSHVRKSMLADQILIISKETLYPFTREEVEIQNAFGEPKTVSVVDNDTAVNLCSRLPAYFCVAESNKIYNKLNIPMTMVIYPCQNMSLKYEFGWIKKSQTELTVVEKSFIEELMKLFH